MPRIINLDNNNENADWIKSVSASRGRVDVPGVRSIYDLFERVGVNTSAPDAPEQIVKFYEEHKWIMNINEEAKLTVERAMRDLQKMKMESDFDETQS